MGVPGNANALVLASAAVSGGYQIQRSLRFNSGDSAYLNRTFGTPTTQGTFTLAMWVKRSVLSTTQSLLGVSTNHSFGFTSGDALNLTFGGTSALTTTAVFRDSSAWYHIVWTQSGTSHTVYVNGTSQGTATATSSVFNTAVAHQLGASNTTNFLNSYLADVHFIDGQALTPSSFAETDAITGQWIPKLYSGSYGTNGFKLNFSDNSTTAALGTDTSGNGNTWTVNNLSVTAGSGNDSLVDTPTSYGTDTGVGGEVRGNYCTLNPLDNSSGMTLANGNLDGSETGGGHKGTRATIKFPSSGKWYYEGTVTTLGGACCIGAATNAAANPDINASGSYYILVNSSGNVQRYQSFASYTGFDTPAVGTILRVAYDADAQKLWLGLNALWMNGSNGTTGDPATGANATFSSITDIYPAIDQQTSAVAVNFGQRAFAYTAPSGFKALCDTNLGAPLVAKPNEVMDVLTYTGNGANRSISGLEFAPDFVWIKSRSSAISHLLYNSVVGPGPNTALQSDNTNAEGGAFMDNSTYGYLSSFDSTGFSLVPGSSPAYVNTNGTAYVAWTWDAGTSTVTDNSGSIQSTRRSNASSGFSVVTYTGTGSNATVGHGLGVAPGMVIVKRRDTTSNWQVRHTSIAAANSIQLNLTNAAASATTVWNSTAPSSTVFSIGTDASVNASGGTYVAYCFAPVAGYSNGFSYTGNGSADGSFVYLGFRPRLIMLKRSDSTSNWTLLDTSREGYNVDNDPLYPNLGDAEGTTDLLDITSNGFKLRSTDASVNASAGTYIGFAWAENPFQYARAR